MSLPRLVLGLDPGTHLLGFCLLKTGEPTPRKIGALEYKGSAYFRLGHVAESIEKLVDEIQASSDEKLEVALEAVYFSRNVQALVMLARAQGAIIPVLSRRGVRITEYHASKIKKGITGNGAAKKPEVARVIGRLLSIDVSKLPLDATDAAGLAYFHANRSDLFWDQQT